MLNYELSDHTTLWTLLKKKINLPILVTALIIYCFLNFLPLARVVCYNLFVVNSELNLNCHHSFACNLNFHLYNRILACDDHDGESMFPGAALVIVIFLELLFIGKLLIFLNLHKLKPKQQNQTTTNCTHAHRHIYEFLGTTMRTIECSCCSKQVFSDNGEKDLCRCRRSILERAYLPLEQFALDMTSYDFWRDTIKNRESEGKLFFLRLIVVGFILTFFIIFSQFSFYFSIHTPAILDLQGRDCSSNGNWERVVQVFHLIHFLYFFVQMVIISIENSILMCYIVLYSAARIFVNTDDVTSVIIVIVIGLYYLFSPFLSIQSDYNQLKEQVFKIVDEYTTENKQCYLSVSKMKEKASQQFTLKRNSSTQNITTSTKTTTCNRENLQNQEAAESEPMLSETEQRSINIDRPSCSTDYTPTNTESECTGSKLQSNRSNVRVVLYSETPTRKFNRIPKPLWDYIQNEFLSLAQRKLNAIFIMIWYITAFVLILKTVNEFDQDRELKSVTDTLIKALPLLFPKLIQLLVSISYTNPGSPMYEWNQNILIKKKVISYIKECKIDEDSQHLTSHSEI